MPQRAAEQVRVQQHEHDREHGPSKSCIGTCLILSIARQPNVSDTPSADGLAGRTPTASRGAQCRLGEHGRARWRSWGSRSSSFCVIGGRLVGGWPVVQEHLVEARLARANSLTATSAGRAPSAPPRPVPGPTHASTARPDPIRAGSGRRGHRRGCGPRPDVDRGRAANVQRARADERLELAARASAMTWPWSMIAMRSASWSASSRYCVVSKTVVPAATSTRTISHTWLRLRGSSPVVGSSRNNRSGVTTILAAMSRRRRIPPE